MRSALLAAAFYALAASPASAEMRKIDCKVMSASVDAAARSMTQLSRSLECDALGPLIEKADGPMQLSARRANAARQAMLPHLKAFAENLEDLNHQIRVCAR